jgi:UDP-N-acetylmuramate dehydrogenase
MNAAPQTRNFTDRLPQVRGRYTLDAPLAPTTWFRVGGAADVLFKPADLADLQDFLAQCPADIPVTVIGAASNIIVRDGGVEGVVIKLGGAFGGIEVDGTTVTAGAAALDVNVALAAQLAGAAGLEFLSGIPGSIGGALRMNAGAYGAEVKDVLVKANAVDRAGRLHVFTPSAMNYSYRHCGLPHDLIFTSCTLQGRPDTPEVIAARMAEIAKKREESQPIRARTGGSTFANPKGAKAWELIDKAGCRGLTLGGAQVSEKHCNFLINTGTASASELENLGEQVKNKVRDTSGVELRWEIERVGRPLKGAHKGD